MVPRGLEIARGPTCWGGRGLCSTPQPAHPTLFPGPSPEGSLKWGEVIVKRSSGRLLRRELGARP